MGTRRMAPALPPPLPSLLLLLPLLLVAQLALAQGGAQNVTLRVTPMDPPPILNGSDLRLVCNASAPAGQPLRWSLCRISPSSCRAIPFQHTVASDPAGTGSVLQLTALAMPGRASDEGLSFLCHIGQRVTMANYQYVTASTTVFVGVPPYPVQNLHCASRDLVHFNCSWEQQGYAGLRTRSTIFQYRQLGDSDWTTTVLEKDLYQFRNVALAYTMQIRVTQTNELGRSNATTINFNVGTETIPNRPEGVAVTFDRDAMEAISMQMAWDLPREWTESPSLLEYIISYKDSRTGNSTTIHRDFETDRRYTVPDILPYTTYTVRVKCKVGGALNWSEWSAPVEALSLESAPSGEVMALDISSPQAHRDPYRRNVQLTWEPPKVEDRHGVIRGYLLYVSPSSLPQPINTTEPSYLLSDLAKFSSYHVRVAAYTMDDALGPDKAIDIPDMTAVPAAVENFKAVSETPNTILVAWNKTAAPRGVVLGYIVKWNERGHPNSIHKSQLNAATTEHQLANLRPYTQYEISIIVLNKKGESRPVVNLATTQFARPSQPLNLRPHKSTPTKLSLLWDDPEAWNGPARGFEVHYRPSRLGAEEGTNKSVSVNRVPLAVNCSAHEEEPVPFTFLVFASTGTSEADRLLGEPAILEREMCGPSYSITGIIIGVLIAAFCVMCLLLCLFTVKRPIMKPSPDPYFIDGILGPPNDKFKINSRLATRRQEKEDYDVLKTCESVRGLIGQRSEPGSAKGSMSSSAGSSSDQGFHEMAPDVPIIAQYSNIGLEVLPGSGSGAAVGPEAKPYTRCSSGYGHSLQSQSEQDLLQKQRMLLSPSEEYAEDVFDCPEDVDGDLPRGEFVNSYRTTPGARPSAGAKESRPRSAPPADRATAAVRHGFAPAAGGNDALSMDYCQMGVNLPPQPPRPKEPAGPKPVPAGDDPEADISYTKVALEDSRPGEDDPSRLYHSVWPSTPDNLDSSKSGPTANTTTTTTTPSATIPANSSSPASGWSPGGFVTNLGFNNNSKEIPAVRSPGGVFASPLQQDMTTAAAPPAKPAGVSAPRLSSVDSEDYIDIVGGGSSPRANATLLGGSATTAAPTVARFALPSKGDLTCQDYIRQCDLPPASPLENMV